MGINVGRRESAKNKGMGNYDNLDGVEAQDMAGDGGGGGGPTFDPLSFFD